MCPLMKKGPTVHCPVILHDLSKVLHLERTNSVFCVASIFLLFSYLKEIVSTVSVCVDENWTITLTILTKSGRTDEIIAASTKFHLFPTGNWVGLLL